MSVCQGHDHKLTACSMSIEYKFELTSCLAASLPNSIGYNGRLNPSDYFCEVLSEDDQCQIWLRFDKVATYY